MRNGGNVLFPPYIYIRRMRVRPHIEKTHNSVRLYANSIY